VEETMVETTVEEMAVVEGEAAVEISKIKGRTTRTTREIILIKRRLF
jgi:hypothetical protein